MSKTIYFNIPSTGHVNPTIPVIQELVKRGEEVLYVNTEKHRLRIEATGAKFIPYPDSKKMEISMDENAGEGNIIKNMLGLIKLSAKLYPFTIEVIESEKPDYLLYDSLASWGKLASKKYKIPSIAFFTTFAFNRKSIRIPLKTIFDSFLKLFIIFPKYLLYAIKMKLALGIFPVFLFKAPMSSGKINIVFTSKEFQPGRDSFDGSYRFVGPTIENRKDNVVFPFHELKESILVYISLGTLANNPRFFSVCFEAFGKEKGQFILSVGKQTDISTLGKIPENFIVKQVVPQLEILQRVNLFITHAGLNGVHESLMYGVPMIAIPHQMEQAMVAMEMEKHGAGIALHTSPPYGNISAIELFASYKKILSSSSYATNAKILGETLKKAGGTYAGVDIILKNIKFIS